MNEQKSTFCKEILSSIINEEISDFFVCQKYSNHKQKNYAKSNWKEEIACITKHSLIFIGSALDEGIKRQFDYTNIESIIIGNDNDTSKEPNQLEEESKISDSNKSDIKDKDNNIIIILKEGIKNKIKIRYLFNFPNSLLFFDKFSKKYKLFFIRNRGIITKLKVKENFKTKTSQETEKYIHVGNYKFKQFQFFRLDINKSRYYFRRDKTQDYSREARIHIKLLDECPIEKLLANPNIANFKFCAWSSLCLHLMYETSGVFILSINERHIDYSDQNRNDIWNMMEYQIRIKPKSGKDKNVLYYYIRRKYIPPLFETYNDFIFIFEELYDESNNLIEIDNDSFRDLNTLIDTFRCEKIPETNKVTEELIKMKMNSYLVDSSTMKHLYFSFDSLQATKVRRIACILELKLIQIHEKYEKKKVQEIKMNSLKELQSLSYFLDGEVLIPDTFLKKLHYSTFFDLLNNFHKDIDKLFSKTSASTNFLWKNKINNFLQYVITFHDSESDSLFKMLDELTKTIPSSIEEIDPIFKLFLNLCATTTNEKIIENVSISYIVNNISNIKEISYNTYFMNYFIAHNKLKRIEKIESELIYYQFLLFLLNTNYNIDTLGSIHDYLFKVCNNYLSFDLIDDYSNNLKNDELVYDSPSSEKKYSSIFNKKFMQLFTQSDSCTIPITLSLKCLIYLSSINPQNLSEILTDEVMIQLSKNISSFDQNLIYYSLFFVHKITELSNESNILLDKFPEILLKVINKIKGSGIPEGKNHPLIILKSLQILKNCLQNNQIKAYILEYPNRKFLKYIFRLITKQENYSFKEDNFYINILSLSYEVLSLAVDKNTDIRQYISTNFHFFNVIEYKSVEYYEFFEFIVNNNIMNTDTNKIPIIKQRQNELIKEYNIFLQNLFEFISKYVGNDLNILNEAKYTCKHLVFLCYKIAKYLRQKEKPKTNQNYNSNNTNSSTDFTIETDTVEKVLQIFKQPTKNYN